MICVCIEDCKEHQYIIRFYERPPLDAGKILTLHPVASPHGDIPQYTILPYTGELTEGGFTAVWRGHCIPVSTSDAVLYIRWD